MKNCLAIDIGGSKIEICRFNDKCEIISSKKLNTKKFSIGSVEFLEEIKTLIRENLDDSICKIGISFNCVVKKGVVLYSSLLGGEINFDIEGEFLKEFNLPVKLMNDVNAMALAESVFGKGSNVESFVLLNLGTGIRPSFVTNNVIIEGCRGNFGEISQRELLIPEFDGLIKNDDLISGKGISNIYKKISKKDKDAYEIFELCRQDDRDALGALTIFRKYLASFLQDISYFYNPERIILNGSLKKASDLFLPQVINTYRENTLEIFHFKDMVISDIDHSACLGVIQ